jgi:hypothetical protein
MLLLYSSVLDMLDVREWAAGDLSKSLLVNTLGGGDLSFDALLLRSVAGALVVVCCLVAIPLRLGVCVSCKVHAYWLQHN